MINNVLFGTHVLPYHIVKYKHYYLLISFYEGVYGVGLIQVIRINLAGSENMEVKQFFDSGQFLKSKPRAAEPYNPSL